MAGFRLFSILFLFILSSSTYAKFSTLAVYSEPNADKSSAKIAVGTWDLPDSPPDGYYRVKMIRSEICNSDRRVMAGTKTAEVTKKRIVLGHEGIGRIFQLPTNHDPDLKIGDLVALRPHYVEKNDPMESKGLPNLSKDMKHLGIHINGVFADYMDFPKYNIFKIPGAEKILNSSADKESYYDQMVMIEPLSCVQRGYKLIRKQDYFKNVKIKTAIILGAGPMGIIHALHLQNQYPEIAVEIYDIDPLRTQLAKNLKYLKAKVLDNYPASKNYDLVVLANSSKSANTKSSIELVKNNGIVLLFSGVDMMAGEHHPIVGGIDIEDIHRYEGSVRLMNYEVGGKLKSIYFVGTSGYVTEDFISSVKELHKDFLRGTKSIYKEVSTTMIVKLDNKTATDLTKRSHDITFDKPAIIPLLQLYDDNLKGDNNVHNHLKIVVKHI